MWPVNGLLLSVVSGNWPDAPVAIIGSRMLYRGGSESQSRRPGRRWIGDQPIEAESAQDMVKVLSCVDDEDMF